MKNIIFYLGKIGSGKSYVAKKMMNGPEFVEKSVLFIEVSDLVEKVAAKLVNKKVPSRSDLQSVKNRMIETNPRWLIDALFGEITSSDCENIIICGLREKWIFDEIEAKYGCSKIFIVEARDDLRCCRRALSLIQLQAAEKQDDEIGLDELLRVVRDRAVVIQNNYEYTS